MKYLKDFITWATKGITLKHIIIAAILAIGILKGCQEINKVKKHYSELLTALNAKLDDNTAMEGQVTTNNLKILKADLLDSLRADGIKAKQVTNVYNITNTYGDTLQLHLHDTTINNIIGQYFSYDDGCFSTTGIVRGDSATLTYDLTDSLDIVGYWKRKDIDLWLFKLPWGKKQTFVKVQGKCSNAQYKFDSALRVVKD